MTCIDWQRRQENITRELVYRLLFLLPYDLKLLLLNHFVIYIVRFKKL